MFYLLYYTEDMDLKKVFSLIHRQTILFTNTCDLAYRDEIITL